MAIAFLWVPIASARPGLLHPQTSESREVLSLDGIWRFRVDTHGVGMHEGWAHAGLTSTVPMAVPSSYNDLMADTALREHVGLVWYERECFVPVSWREKRVVLYVGSANHHAVAWLNGKRVGEHEGGHLPFHLPLDTPGAVDFGRANRLTIAVNNTLSTTSIPPGFVQTNAAGRRIQRLQMDFFHYAGLHRQVLLYTTPLAYLDDLLVSCRLEYVLTLTMTLTLTLTSNPNPNLDDLLVSCRLEYVLTLTLTSAMLKYSSELTALAACSPTRDLA